MDFRPDQESLLVEGYEASGFLSNSSVLQRFEYLTAGSIPNSSKIDPDVVLAALHSQLMHLVKAETADAVLDRMLLTDAEERELVGLAQGVRRWWTPYRMLEATISCYERYLPQASFVEGSLDDPCFVLAESVLLRILHGLKALRALCREGWGDMCLVLRAVQEAALKMFDTLDHPDQSARGVAVVFLNDAIWRARFDEYAKKNAIAEDYRDPLLGPLQEILSKMGHPRLSNGGNGKDKVRFKNFDGRSKSWFKMIPEGRLQDEAFGKATYLLYADIFRNGNAYAHSYPTYPGDLPFQEAFPAYFQQTQPNTFPEYGIVTLADCLEVLQRTRSIRTRYDLWAIGRYVERRVSQPSEL